VIEYGAAYRDKGGNLYCVADLDDDEVVIGSWFWAVLRHGLDEGAHLQLIDVDGEHAVAKVLDVLTRRRNRVGLVRLMVST